ncbi:hypothetical protein EV384_4918 [Micromonospora kangleipakensis]|uniref:Modulator of FtsH protease n=1 Tax=Micromonospora kangleipakensis TaxID=1077942 RepID=A0A4Q8BFT4_9ACTN|nr:hypothetical protein [Micromonospora kangleipakensis]RZU76281.1 hypothetical protein EV384_4918 [Micromonospora kangleipakensis]
MDVWTSFFSAMAGVSTALMTIAFLVFQLKSDAWRTNTLRHFIALFTLAEFATPLVISLVILMPSHPWRLASAVVGAGGLVMLVSYWIAYSRTDEPTPFDRLEFRLSAISLVCYVALTGAAALPEKTGVYLVGGLSVWFLVSGSIEAWQFLVPPPAAAPRANAVADDTGSNGFGHTSEMGSDGAASR